MAINPELKLIISREIAVHQSPAQQIAAIHKQWESHQLCPEPKQVISRIQLLTQTKR